MDWSSLTCSPISNYSWNSGLNLLFRQTSLTIWRRIIVKYRFTPYTTLWNVKDRCETSSFHRQITKLQLKKHNLCLSLLYYYYLVKTEATEFRGPHRIRTPKGEDRQQSLQSTTGRQSWEALPHGWWYPSSEPLTGKPTTNSRRFHFHDYQSIKINGISLSLKGRTHFSVEPCLRMTTGDKLGIICIVY